MANEVEIRVTADTKAAERDLKDMRGSIDKFAKRARVAGAALTGIGVVGAVGLKKLIGSYKEQEIGISKLNQALVNVGHTYAGNETAIERVIDAIQRKTNFGDEEQRESLQTLITIGGQYEGSLEALKVATDLSVGGKMDLKSASLLLAKAIAGETSSLSRYGIKLAEGATQTEIMAALTDQFGGMAEAAADPLTQLGNRAGDVGQSFGQHLSPFVDAAAKVLERLMDKFSKIDPKWQRAIALIAGMTVVFALIAGPLLLFIGLLPLLAGGFGAIGAAALPVTLAIAGIAAAVLIGIAVWRNWDKVLAFVRKTSIGKFIEALLSLKNNWREIWSRMQEIFQTVVKNIVGGVEAVLNGIVDMVNGALRIAKKMGLMSDVAEIDKFAFDFAEMSQIVTNKMRDMVEVVGGKARGLGTSMKEGIGGAVTDLGGMFTRMMDKFGLGIDKVDTQMRDHLIPTLGVELPDAAEEGEKGLKGLGDAADKTGEKVGQLQTKIKTFNELVQAGQFQTRVRGGMPEVVAYGAGEVERRGIPSMDIFAQKDLLLSVSRISNQTERNLRLQSTLGAFGGPVIEELKFMVEHIQSAANFTQEGIADFAKTVRTNAAIQAREQSIKEAWAMNPRNPNNVNILRTIIDEPGLAHGGIVTRPTRALLGEAGPEAIIPLRGGGAGMAPTYNITISGNTVFGEMDFKRLVVKAVTDSHRRGGLPFLGK